MEARRRTSIAVLLLVLLSSTLPVYAQRPAAGLTDQQRSGRRVYVQACAACHLPAGRERTYGPSLNRTTNAGRDDTMKMIIRDGTPRMPGFRHSLSAEEIDAIVAYLRTVAPSALATAR